MLRQSKITKDTPFPPVETAVWWVEHVLRHNGCPHLRPAALDLSWYQYFMLDILLLLVILISTGLFVIYYIFRYFVIRALLPKKSFNKIKTN